MFLKIKVNENLKIKLNMADVSFSFHEKEKILNPAIHAPEGSFFFKYNADILN
jgi:hypothetical protein